MWSAEHSNLKRKLVWEHVIYPQPVDCSLQTYIYVQRVSNNTDGTCPGNTYIKLGYTVEYYTVQWPNVTSRSKGSGIEYNTQIMKLHLEQANCIRCDLGTIFLLQGCCLHKHGNESWQFLLVCKLEFYKCTLWYCVLLPWHRSFPMSLFQYCIKRVTDCQFVFSSFISGCGV